MIGGVQGFNPLRKQIPEYYFEICWYFLHLDCFCFDFLKDSPKQLSVLGLILKKIKRQQVEKRPMEIGG